MKTAFGLNLSKNVSSELLKLVKCFAALADSGPDADEERADVFELGNPSGKDNLMNVKGFHTYTRKMLLDKFPSTASKVTSQQKTPGQDVYEAFEPILSFAFDMAAAWKHTEAEDDAAAATAVDMDALVGNARVSLDQFRVLNAFVCVVAAMYDAFFLITREPSIKATMDAEQWGVGSRHLSNYDFAAFATLGEGALKFNQKALSSFFYANLTKPDEKICAIQDWFDFIKKEVRRGIFDDRRTETHSLLSMTAN